MLNESNLAQPEKTIPDRPRDASGRIIRSDKEMAVHYLRGVTNSLLTLLKNASERIATAKKTISGLSLNRLNRVQTRLGRKNSRHFSCIFAHRQKEGVLQQNPFCPLTSHFSCSTWPGFRLCQALPISCLSEHH